MHECKPLAAPMHLKGHHFSASETMFLDPTTYHNIIRGLQYLTFTRPDIFQYKLYLSIHADTISGSLLACYNNFETIARYYYTWSQNII